MYRFFLLNIFIALFISSETYADFYPKLGRYEGELLLKDVARYYENTGISDPGHTEFELLKKFSFIDVNGRHWTAPSGTVVNGASIPKSVWSWAGGPWSGKYRRAAVIHDWMCEFQVSSSNTAHKVFYEAMLVSGVPKFRAWIMYQAVLRGGPQWSLNEFGPSRVHYPDLSEQELNEIILESKQHFQFE